MKKILGAAIFSLLATTSALAAYPEKPIRLIVPFPPGQTTDIIARTFGEELQKELKTPVYIDNKAGAGGIIGTEAAKKATPDGYSILFTSGGPAAINESLYKNIPYKTLSDFQPIAVLYEMAQVIVTRKEYPADTVPALVEQLKKKPGTNYASGGVGLTNHLTLEMFKRTAGLDLNHVPYKGATAALTGLISGDVDLMVESIPAAMPHVKSGRLKIIATGSSSGLAGYPEVPSIAKYYPGFHATTWVALLAPNGTPVEVTQKINAAINNIMKTEKVKKVLQENAAEIMTTTPAEAASYIDKEIKKWNKIITDGNISAD